MKKRRRVEITTFRRRTVIVLRNRAEAHADGEASHRLRADLPTAVDIDSDQTHKTDPDCDPKVGLNWKGKRMIRT
jgi:hypothetical protein